LNISNILDNLKKIVSQTNFDRYFKQMIIVSSNEDEIVFEVPNKFIANFIKTKFKDLIQDIIKKEYSKELEILFIAKGECVAKTIAYDTPAIDQEDSSNSSTILNPSYTFDNFVVGQSNQMAYTAALSVARTPGKQYNPLFLYGKTGLGKTHLLQAIGNYNITKNRVIIYVTVDQLTSDYISSVNNHTMDIFRAKYRKCDILLIDDVQFLVGKEGTQDEFFFTFNELHDNEKQIVLTSDRSPSKIKGLVDRLKTRFEWGLMADIELPGIETKIGIIQKKCELSGIILPQEVINFLATNLNSSIREIEGAIIRINALIPVLGKELDLDIVKQLLKDQIQEISQEINMNTIIETVAKELNIKPSEIKSKKRTKNITNARRIIIYLARELTQISMPEIAKELNLNDHSAVSKNITKANELILQDDSFKVIVNNIKNMLKSETE